MWRGEARQFDFSLDAERAAIGRLLEQISEDARERCGGLLLSALVQFWLGQVTQLHARHARPRRRPAS